MVFTRTATIIGIRKFNGGGKNGKAPYVGYNFYVVADVDPASGIEGQYAASLFQKEQYMKDGIPGLGDDVTWLESTERDINGNNVTRIYNLRPVRDES